MAKTYISTIKYEILANYEVQGVVEKPDLVGAIFGQSEGLLGQDMDLKELQQNGKIGRIEVTIIKGKGTTSGQIVIPSSLDQVKTSILAATMETVEKVGPFEAKVRVLKITDTRKEKRETITERAKELLKHMQKFEGVESDEMAQGIKEDARADDIINYEGLAAGPEVNTSKEIIVVEGRADVLKLLGYGIKNAIAMNGANITAELITLCNEKTVTVLADGDRGGELNIAKLGSLTKIDFVAKAPDGKEVEELTQKEILQALKRKQKYVPGTKPTPFPQQGFNPQPQYGRNFQGQNQRYSGFNRQPNQRFGQRPFGQQNSFGQRGSYGQRSFGQRPQFGNNFRQPFGQNNFNRAPQINAQTPIKLPEQKVELPKEFEKLKKDFSKMKGKSKAKLLDDKKKKIKEVYVKDLLETIDKSKKKITTILFDGIVTNRLVETAEKKGIKNLIGVRKGNITPNEKVSIYTIE